MYTGTDCDMLCIQAGATEKLLWAGVSPAGRWGGKAAARGKKTMDSDIHSPFGSHGAAACAMVRRPAGEAAIGGGQSTNLTLRHPSGRLTVHRKKDREVTGPHWWG